MNRIVGKVGQLVRVVHQVVQFKTRTMDVGVDGPCSEAFGLVTQRGLPGGGTPEVTCERVIEFPGYVVDKLVLLRADNPHGVVVGDFVKVWEAKTSSRQPSGSSWSTMPTNERPLNAAGVS